MIALIRDIELPVGAGEIWHLLEEVRSLRNRLNLKALTLKQIDAAEELNPEKCVWRRFDGDTFQKRERDDYGRLTAVKVVEHGASLSWEAVQAHTGDRSDGHY